jgi:membrane protease YdiL (CAAX protease family)
VDVTETSAESAPPAIARPRPLWKRVLAFPLVALILAFLVITVAQTLGAGVSYLAGNRPPALAVPTDLVFALATTVLSVLAYKLVVVRMGEQPRDDLPFDPRARDAAGGFLQGGLVFSAIVGVAALTGSYQALGLSPAEDWLPLLLGTGLMAGVTEEILLRGIVFRWLEELGGSWVALALSALLFGFLHAANPNATLISSLSIALAAGVLLGGAYMLTRNLVAGDRHACRLERHAGTGVGRAGFGSRARRLGRIASRSANRSCRAALSGSRRR